MIIEPLILLLKFPSFMTSPVSIPEQSSPTRSLSCRRGSSWSCFTASSHQNYLSPSLVGEGQGGQYLIRYQDITDPTPPKGHPSP